LNKLKTDICNTKAESYDVENIQDWK